MTSAVDRHQWQGTAASFIMHETTHTRLWLSGDTLMESHIWKPRVIYVKRFPDLRWSLAVKDNSIRTYFFTVYLFF